MTTPPTLASRSIHIDQGDRLTLSETMGLLRCSWATVKRYTLTGVLGVHAVGRRSYVSLHEVLALRDNPTD